MLCCPHLSCRNPKLSPLAPSRNGLEPVERIEAQPLLIHMDGEKRERERERERKKQKKTNLAKRERGRRIRREHERERERERERDITCR